MLTLEQKAIRRTGIGSSDIAAIVGKSPYANPMDVYLSKAEGFEREGNFSTELGDLLEDAVLTLYERRHGPEVLVRRPGTWVHPRIPIIVDTPDALASWGSTAVPVEAKTSRFSDFDLWGEEGTDQVPENYLIQGTWHLIVARARAQHPADVTRCDLPVLIRTDEFRVYRIDWSEDLAAMLVDEAQRFWANHIERRVPPDVEGSRTVHDFLKHRYPRDSGQMLAADEEIEMLLREFFLMDATAKQADEMLKAVKAKLQLRIGDASGIAGACGQVTWKKAKDTETTDWEALARKLLAEKDAAARTQLLKEFHLVKPGSRRFLGKPEKFVDMKVLAEATHR